MSIMEGKPDGQRASQVLEGDLKRSNEARGPRKERSK